MSALGPAMGFLMGALFLAIFVNPHEEPNGLTESDSNWVRVVRMYQVKICSMFSAITLRKCLLSSYPG